MTKRAAIHVGFVAGMLILPFVLLIIVDPSGFAIALMKTVAAGVIGGLIGLVVYLLLSRRQRKMIDRRSKEDGPDVQ